MSFKVGHTWVRTHLLACRSFGQSLTLSAPRLRLKMGLRKLLELVAGLNEETWKSQHSEPGTISETSCSCFIS